MVIRKTYFAFIFILSASFLILSGCFSEKPLEYDGNLRIEIFVDYDSSFIAGIPVRLTSTDLTIPSRTDTTDSLGRVLFSDLPWSNYKITVKTQVPDWLDTLAGSDLLIVGGMMIYADSISDGEYIDTLTIQKSARPGLKINELYTVGPPNDMFYFYDQFMELYNSSEDTVYLDGMIVCRMGQFLESVTYIFQFPGEPLTGREYPVPPHAFVVLAQDAYDHRTIIPASIDLRSADWEFRNSADYGDYDNPDVPNIDNIEVGHHLDFMIALTCDVVLIADGSDLEYQDGIDAESVLDCVEYCSSSSHTKDIEPFLDRGFGGVGLQKYSGESLERVAPGFDTNNSTLDFEIIEAPTPGYQHE